MVKTCEWYWLCRKEAITDVDHPTLGKVPTCSDHAKWVVDVGFPMAGIPALASRVMKNREAAYMAGEK